MKIFILEDNKERIEIFKKLFKCHTVYFFDNVSESIKFLETTIVNAIFLDHDLDDKIFVQSNEKNTGYQLAKYLITNPNYKKTQIYIHSMNPIGAKQMYDTLKKKKYNVKFAPFNLVIKYLAIQ